ncbi:MAG: aspartate aminotransferase, partial [Pseudomonadota bacterium]
FLRKWAKFRGLAAPQVPLPAQAVAVRAYQDEDHVIENRRLYNQKFEAAERLLGPIMGKVTAEGGFFLWLDVSRWADGISITSQLWSDCGVKVVPGGFLASDQSDGTNPGRDFIRVGLTAPLAQTEIALERMARWFGEQA